MNDGSRDRPPVTIDDSDVAVVAMSGRFPGAADVEQLWERVRDGEDCLTDLTREDLVARGVASRVVDDPSYVRRTGVLADVDRFDPEFFGIGARDAALMDPQHRHFLECSWEALESAGIDPATFPGSIGVFAGSGMNTYLLHCLLADPQLVDELGWFLLRHTGNDKDFLSTLVSYRLDLRGPSINVQTACSTSLVAVHLAVQSLLGFECDLALAGGVTIEVPVGVGYRYQEGEILSPRGRCRAFDAASDGTVLTSGVAIVGLRRLRDAWDDGDPILAVLKGSAVNNDGSRKVSFLAPSVDGHGDVVSEALEVAGLAPGDIQLVEAHGTGTALGDPIEFAALSAAFGDQAAPGGCRLVSTKPNIGHLDTAAGAASLIKVVQALRHRTLPPLANHTGPSDLLELEDSPFVLSGRASPWPGDRPRRAGVSSLGVGGTNAHVVVEEAPVRPRVDVPRRPVPLLLSARDDGALAAVAARLADHLERHQDLPLVDVAHTLRVGRRHHGVRRVVGAADIVDAVARLRQAGRAVTAADPGGVPPRTVFMFPGGGSQYAGMGVELDERFAVFHEVRGEVLEEVARWSEVDVGVGLDPDVDPAVLDDPRVALPLVFGTSLAMARQWMSLGVEPDAMIGHSLGEYVAAHLAGVFDLASVVQLVVARSRLMASVGGEDAAMLVVPRSEDELAPLLTPRISLAVVNGPEECVLAGERAEVEDLAARLAAEGTECSLLALAAAAHSALLDPVLDEFRDLVRSVPRAAPDRPFVSNVSGTWITPAEATDPEHWVRHLRETNRFGAGLATALAEGPTMTVELGPGHTLTATARRAATAPLLAVASMRHPRQAIAGTTHAVEALAQRWALGMPVDLDALVDEGLRIPLPTYPFRRERFWIDPPDRAPTSRVPVVDVAAVSDASPPARLDDTRDMWSEVRWIESDAPARADPRRWIVVGGGAGDVDELVAALGPHATEVVSVCDAAEMADQGIRDGDAIAVLGPDDDAFDAAAAIWMGAATDVVRALGAGATVGNRLALVTRGGLPVGGSAPRPADALALGIARVAPSEYPDLDAVLVDTDPDGAGDLQRIAAELAGPTPGRLRTVALRSGRRLVPEVVATPLDDDGTGFVAGGTYLVTGGLGGVGHVMARHLVDLGSTLCLVTSHPLPVEAERTGWLRRHGPLDRTSRRLRRLADLESAGSRVEVLVGDLGDPSTVALLVEDAIGRVGRLDGVIHAAGVLHDDLIATLAPSAVDDVIGAKARGAISLVRELSTRSVPLLVLVSSTSTLLGAPGQAAYVGANAVLDSLAGRHGDTRVVTLVSGMWTGTGMADEFERRSRLGLAVGVAIDHPVFEEVVRSPREPHVVDVVGHLDPGHHWIVGDHRVAGDAVLPGSGHLELLLAAVHLVDQRTGPVALSSVVLSQPLLVPDGAPLTIRVRVTDDPGRRRLTLESAPRGDHWEVHSTAELDEPGEGPGTTTEVHEGRPGPTEVVDPFEGQRMHLDLGPRWATSATVRAGDRSIDGRLAWEGDPDDDGLWRASPPLVDAATGLAARLARRAAPGEGLFVPVGYRSVRWHRPVPTIVDVEVALEAGQGAMTADVTVRDPVGPPVLEVRGLALWQLEPERRLAPSGHRGDVGVSGAGPGLLDLAVTEGITPSEGVALLEQLLADGRDRLVASSVDLVSLLDADAGGPPTAVDPAGAAHSADPTASVAAQIAAMWAGLLGVEPGPTDDFFELGGHSLLAIRLVAQITRAFGVDFQLADIIEGPTLGDMVRHVESSGSVTSTGASVAPSPPATGGGSWSPLVSISPAGRRTPFFLVHGAGGNVMFSLPLARALGDDRPFYGIQAAGCDGSMEPDGSIDEMVERNVAALVAAHAGPYLLGGYSGGGLVALEMATKLIEMGAEVPRVVLFDSVPPGRTRPPRRDRLANLASHVRHGRLLAMRDYVAMRLRSTVRRQEFIAPEDADDVVSLFDHFSAAAERHPLGVYDVDVTLVKADLVWPTQPHDYYWGGRILGDLDIRTSSGDHHTMFSTRCAGHLADVVRRGLAGL